MLSRTFDQLCHFWGGVRFTSARIGESESMLVTTCSASALNLQFLLFSSSGTKGFPSKQSGNAPEGANYGAARVPRNLRLELPWHDDWIDGDYRGWDVSRDRQHGWTAAFSPPRLLRVHHTTSYVPQCDLGKALRLMMQRSREEAILAPGKTTRSAREGEAGRFDW